MKVDVGVAKGAARDGVTADADGGDRADAAKDLVEHRLRDLVLELPDVQGGRGGGGGVGSGSSSSNGLLGLSGAARRQSEGWQRSFLFLVFVF